MPRHCFNLQFERHIYSFSFFQNAGQSYMTTKYLAIIPRARMGYESIAHEAEGQVGYWLRGYEGERNDYFSKIQLVVQRHRD